MPGPLPDDVPLSPAAWLLYGPPGVLARAGGALPTPAAPPYVVGVRAWRGVVTASLSRRGFLKTGAAGLLLASGLRPARVAAAPPFSPSPAPFSLDIASGDPTPNSVILWTRLANDPLDGGGMPAVPIPVEWEVAIDSEMDHVVRRGVAVARPASAHTVHVTVHGLAPDSWYFYRFRAGSDVSPIGLTRTFPAPDSEPARMKFAFVSCQHFEEGFY